MYKGVLFRSFIFCFFVVTVISCSRVSNHQTSVSKLDSLLNSALDSLDKNPQKTYQLISEARKIAKDSAELYVVSDYLTNYYLKLGMLDSANLLLTRIKYFIDSNQLPDSNKWLTNYNNSKGVYFSQMNYIDSALCFYSKAYQYASKIPDYKKLPDVCINVADAAIRKGRFVDGIQFYRKALLVADTLKMDDAIRFPIYFGLGQAYYSGLRNFELSDTYFKKAEKLYENRSLSEKFTFCNNRGNFYFYKQEYANALPWFLRAKQLVEPLKIDFYIQLCNCNLSDIYLHVNKLDSAKYCFEQSYNFYKNTDNTTILYYLATIRAEIALREGDTQLAGLMLKKHNIQGFIEPEILMIRYKTLEDYYLRTGNYRQAYSQLSKHTALNDSLRSERVENAIAELDARYKQDTTLLKKEVIIRTKDNELETLRTTNLLWIFLALSALLAALSGYLFYKRKRDAQNRKHIDTITKYRFQNIRNRISPHFIFNALNRQLTNEADVEKQQNTHELVKLLRKSLEMADAVAVLLTDEIEFVKGYLKIENARLSDDYEINWDIPTGFESEKWKVPAMIIQIPVENALKHALPLVTGTKKLRIELFEKFGYLNIEVVDNGTGYSPSKISATKGTGTGLKVLQTTIQLLNLKNAAKIEFSIKNLANENETGTKVTIRIPENYNFNL